MSSLRTHVSGQRVVILGSAPSPGSTAPWHPLAASSSRLADLADIEPEELSGAFGLDNLLPIPEPTRSQLKEAAELYRFLPKWWYLLAGTEVVRALGPRARPAPSARLPWHTHGPPALRWYVCREGITMAVLPHPSGRNRWYNDARCRRAAERFVRAAAMGVKTETGERFRRELARSAGSVVGTGTRAGERRRDET